MNQELQEPVSPVALEPDLGFLDEMFPVGYAEVLEENAQLHTKVQHLEAEVHRLTQQTSVLFLDKLAFDEQRMRLIAENNTYQKKIEELQLKVRALESRLCVWTFHSESLSAQITRLNETIAQLEYHISMLQNHIANLANGN